jgi:hypothetical protein
MWIILLTLSLSAFSQTRADFFPKVSQELVIQDKVFEKDKLELGLERFSENYRSVVNYQSLKKMNPDVGFPILVLSQYEYCSKFSLKPFQVNSHFEPTYVETDFKCVVNIDPAGYRATLKKKYCSDAAIRSDAQDKICRGLLLR